MSAPTSARSSPTTAARTGRRSAAGIPTVAVWQLDLDPLHRILAAGTHGRGAFQHQRHVAAGSGARPVEGRRRRPGRAGEQPDYTITLRNIGNAAGDRRDDHRPAPGQHELRVRADGGGTSQATAPVTWTGLSVAPGREHLAVHLDGEHRRRAEEEGHVDHERRRQGDLGPGAVHDRLAGRDADRAAFALSVAPATQTDGGTRRHERHLPRERHEPGLHDRQLQLTVELRRHRTRSASSTRPARRRSRRRPRPSPERRRRLRQGRRPGRATDGDTNTTTVTATSVGSPSLSGSATMKTIAVTKDDAARRRGRQRHRTCSRIYTTALTTAGVSFATWDLAADPNLPQGYLAAHKNVVWFTGQQLSRPDPRRTRAS